MPRVGENEKKGKEYVLGFHNHNVTRQCSAAIPDKGYDTYFREYVTSVRTVSETDCC